MCTLVQVAREMQELAGYFHLCYKISSNAFASKAYSHGILFQSPVFAYKVKAGGWSSLLYETT